MSGPEFNPRDDDAIDRKKYFEYEERQALKKRICKWLFSAKWTDAHTEFDEIEALTDMVEEELRLAPWKEQ
jgi:hypothetical protein